MDLTNSGYNMLVPKREPGLMTVWEERKEEKGCRGREEVRGVSSCKGLGNL